MDRAMNARLASGEVQIATEPTDELLDAFARLLPQLSNSAKPLDKARLDEILRSSCNTLLVAREASSGRIVGALTLVTFHIPTGLRALIEDVVVDSAVRGRGVGEALTRKAVQLALQLQVKSIDLTSRQSRQAAHRLYEKVGFVVRETSVYRYTEHPNKVVGEAD